MIASPIRALMLAGVLGLGACTAWPEDGRGGFAERRAIEEPRLKALAQRFETQRTRGAETYAAGLTHEVGTWFVRAQRNHAAGIYDDVEVDLGAITRLLDAIDKRLARKA
ncbi:MAG: hypothetical protein CFE31_18345 [Rhizobiales bacterium PAR1]|nr:MAG: hypothetical protein CFE31_18345 [Rhizobiales bacterium PAR1]